MPAEPLATKAERLTGPFPRFHLKSKIAPEHLRDVRALPRSGSYAQFRKQLLLELPVGHPVAASRCNASVLDGSTAEKSKQSSESFFGFNRWHQHRRRSVKRQIDN